MSLNEAARTDIALWPGNQESLSHALFSNPQTLRHKLAGFKRMALGLEEAVELMLLTGGRGTMHSMARELGGVYIQLPEGNPEYDNADICAEMERLWMALGDLVREARACIDNDGKIDADEEKRIDQRRHEVTTQLMSYVYRLMAVYGDASTEHYRSQHDARPVAR